MSPRCAPAAHATLRRNRGYKRVDPEYSTRHARALPPRRRPALPARHARASTRFCYATQNASLFRLFVAMLMIPLRRDEFQRGLQVNPRNHIRGAAVLTA